MTEIQEGYKVARAEAIQRAALEIGAEVLYEKWQAAAARAETFEAALRELAELPDKVGWQRAVDQRAMVRIARAALSSEDATRPTGDKE